MKLRLCGLTEIARLLGYSRQRAHQLAQRPDFPRPLATLAQGRVWDREEVEAWIREYRAGGGGGGQES